MLDDLYTLIGYQIEATADWRRRQAEYFPHNDRNARAAKELGRLAAEVDQLEGSSVHEHIRLATDRLKNEDWFAMSKSVYAELRSVGYDGTYDSGLRFLEWYCDRLRARCTANEVAFQSHDLELVVVHPGNDLGLPLIIE